MTQTEAKEIIIDSMNYAAYKETPHSLWPSDMNTLFGYAHYSENQAVYSASVWGSGEGFEKKMVDLLKWAQ